MNKKFFMIWLCCILAVLMCCSFSVFGAFKCPSCGGTNISTSYSQSSSTHVATAICRDCGNIVSRGSSVAHKWNTSHVCTICGYKGSHSLNTSHACTICGYKGSHSYSAKVTKYATCTSEGERKYSCACGASYTEKINVLDHKFSYQGGTKDENNHLLKCQNCSATRYEKHNFNSQNACTVCGYKKIVAVEGDSLKHEHKYEYKSGARNASGHEVKCSVSGCEETEFQNHTFKAGAGYEECTVCGFKNFGTMKPSCNHTKQYSQYDDGSHLVVCLADGWSYTEYHSSKTSATCTTPRKCQYCGKVLEKALGHNYIYNGGTKTETTHTFVCSRDNCNSTTTEKHDFNAQNICTVCGYKKVTTPQTCSHNWKVATCDAPKTCTKCGATEGEALGHNWQDATCTKPKTCTRCKLTDGEALGHDFIYNGGTKTENSHMLYCSRCSTRRAETHKMVNNKCTVCGYEKVTTPQTCSHNWKAATCDAPKTCTKCGATEGETLGHNWQDATCTKPKTCTRCKLTDGEALGHDYIYNGGIKTQNAHMLYCSRCSFKMPQMHKMSNNECTVCGYKKVTTKECEPSKHVYVYNNSRNSSGHEMKCSVCGKVEFQEHNIEQDNIIGNGVCTVCGLKFLGSDQQVINPCSHQKQYSVLYKSDGSIDEGWHLMVCPTCGYAAEVRHNFDTISGRCVNCYVSRKCSKDYITPGHPVYVVKYKMLDNKQVHSVTKRCMECNVTFEYTENHSFNVDGVCVSCGYENIDEGKCTVYRTVEGHNPVTTGKQIMIDSKEHKIYYYCDICNRTFSKNVQHTFVNGVCSCGYAEDSFVCEHDPKNYEITYSKTDDKDKHIKKTVCKICKAEVELREGHEFLSDKCKCGAEFTMQVQRDTSSLIQGEITQINITHNGDKNITFKYESNNTELLNVDEKGLVTALENLKITNERTVSITVRAYSGNGKEIANKKIDMKYNPKYTLIVDIPSEVYLGEETMFIANASADIGDGFIKWNIAGVGDITQGKGSNSITFKPNKLGQVKCQVTIYKNSSSVAREIREINVIERKTKTPSKEMSIFLDDSVKLANVENLKIISGNSVAASGNIVTAVEIGVTTVSDEKGNTYNINVTNKVIPITDIKIDLGRTDNTIFKDEEVQANIIITPANATEEITTKSSNQSVATVTNGGLIVAKKAGETTISVSTSSGKKYEQKIVVKQESLKLTTTLSSIQLSIEQKNFKLEVDKTLLSTETLSTLKYTSSDSSVATISNTGVVTLVKKGNVTIKVSATLLDGKTVRETSLKIYIDDYTREKIGDTKYDKKVGTDENSNRVYVYFSGSGAIENGINASANEKIKKTSYSDTVIVPTCKDNQGSWTEWNKTVKDITTLLQSEEYADKEIILIGYSSGGYPAAEVALALANDGDVSNLTLKIVDGVQGASGRSAIEEYEQLDLAGVNTIIYASNDSRNISKNTRTVGEEFAKRENSNVHYNGELEMTHGKINSYAHDLIGQ